MSLRTRIGSILLALVSIITGLYSYNLYKAKRSEFIDGIDRQLITGAIMARQFAGVDYHDRIINIDSVSNQDYLNLVDSFNRVCQQAGIQYLWSNLVLDDNTIVFTSATSASKDISKGDYAAFFDVHSDPLVFSPVLKSGEKTFSTFRNEWGEGRMVLIPYLDKHERTYVYGASISLDYLNQILRQTAIESFLLFLSMVLFGGLISYALARAISDPLTKLSFITEQIASGKYGVQIKDIDGSREVVSLANSINNMSESIQSEHNQLKSSETHLRTLIETIPDLIWLKDPQGVYLGCNRKFERFFGATEAQIKGKTDYDFVDKELADFFSAKRPGRN